MTYSDNKKFSMTKPFGTLLTVLILFTTRLAFAAQRGTLDRRNPPPQAIEQSAYRVDWEGTYEFSEGSGRSAGAGMIVTHTLAVRKRDDRIVCDLDADGFQTSISLRCDAREEGGKLNIYFDGYREGNVLARYRKGQLLLTLERATVRGKPRLLTRWGAYKPVFDPARGVNISFKKIK
jgi:hypothetical protein